MPPSSRVRRSNHSRASITSLPNNARDVLSSRMVADPNPHICITRDNNYVEMSQLTRDSWEDAASQQHNSVIQTGSNAASLGESKAGQYEQGKSVSHTCTDGLSNACTGNSLLGSLAKGNVSSSRGSILSAVPHSRSYQSSVVSIASRASRLHSNSKILGLPHERRHPISWNTPNHRHKGISQACASFPLRQDSLSDSERLSHSVSRKIVPATAEHLITVKVALEGELKAFFEEKERYYKNKDNQLSEHISHLQHLHQQVNADITHLSTMAHQQNEALMDRKKTIDQVLTAASDKQNLLLKKVEDENARVDMKITKVSHLITTAESILSQIFQAKDSALKIPFDIKDSLVSSIESKVFEMVQKVVKPFVDAIHGTSIQAATSSPGPASLELVSYEKADLKRSSIPRDTCFGIDLSGHDLHAEPCISCAPTAMGVKVAGEKPAKTRKTRGKEICSPLGPRLAPGMDITKTPQQKSNDIMTPHKKCNKEVGKNPPPVVTNRKKQKRQSHTLRPRKRSKASSNIYSQEMDFSFH